MSDFSVFRFFFSLPGREKIFVSSYAICIRVRDKMHLQSAANSPTAISRKPYLNLTSIWDH